MFVVSMEFQLVITNTYHYRPITHRMLHFRKDGGWIELGVPWDHGIPKPKVHRCFVWMHLLGHRAQLHTLSHNQKHNQTRSCKFLRPDPDPSVADNLFSLGWGWWDVLHCRNREIACLSSNIIIFGRKRFGVQYSVWAEWVPLSYHWTCIP